MTHFSLFLLHLGAVNLAAFLAYWRDKSHARNGNWRIPEGTLLLLGVLGGSPASFIAQRVFRHKLRKGSFQLRFWLIVILQIVGIAWFWETIQAFLAG